MKRGLRAPLRALGRTCGLIVLVGLARAGETSRGPEGFAGVRDKIARLVEDRTIPSLSLAVVRDGAIVWEEAFGMADLEKKLPATAETLYPIASATKPFTAAGVMILVERGLVGLDKPANAYLGSARLGAFEGDAAGATVGRVLRHTAGLPMYWSFGFEGAGRPRQPLETTLKRYGRLVNKPGEGFSYSNLGYGVLEAVIERVSGKAYFEFMADEVFLPLGMNRTVVATAPGEVSGSALKYSASLAPIPFCDHDTRAAGGVYSTAHDLALFLLLHLGRLQSGQKPILKPGSIEAMRTSRDPDVRSSSYCLGWETGQRCGFSIVTHGGWMDGCRAHLAMIPGEGLGVAVLINGEGFPSIRVCDWIFAALLPEYARRLDAGPPPAGPAPQPSAFRPPAALVGSWAGAIQTHEGEIPVRLVIEAGGRVELAALDAAGLPGNALEPVKTPAVNRDVFVVHFPQVFSTSDAPAAGHRTVLGLKIRQHRLSGEANLIASDMSYSLPSYIELKRTPGEKGP
jgi:CubicO group peptidase (beta-lactamase class C family)